MLLKYFWNDLGTLSAAEIILFQFQTWLLSGYDREQQQGGLYIQGGPKKPDCIYKFVTPIYVDAD